MGGGCLGRNITSAETFGYGCCGHVFGNRPGRRQRRRSIGKEEFTQKAVYAYLHKDTVTRTSTKPKPVVRCEIPDGSIEKHRKRSFHMPMSCKHIVEHFHSTEHFARFVDEVCDARHGYFGRDESKGLRMPTICRTRFSGKICLCIYKHWIQVKAQATGMMNKQTNETTTNTQSNETTSYRCE